MFVRPLRRRSPKLTRSLDARKGIVTGSCGKCWHSVVSADAADLVCPSPISACGDPARGMGLSPLNLELSGRWVLKFGPAFAQRPRHCRPKPSGCWHLDEMVARIAGETVYLWRAVDYGARHPRAARTRQSGGPEADAQASQEAGLRADCHRDGQVAIVCSGVRGALSGGGPRPRPPAEQQGGSFAPAGPPTRAKDAAVQVSKICSALRRHACRRPQHVQCSTPADLPPHAAPLPSRGDAAMARSDDGRLTVVRLEKRRTSVELP